MDLKNLNAPVLNVLSWCGTHTKIRSKLFDIVTAGSQKITLWAPQRTPLPLGILRVNKHQNFPHSVSSFSSYNLRPPNDYSQSRARTVFMRLGFPTGQSVHCCIQHTPDIPHHIPYPLWLKVISDSISYFLQTHARTHIHTHTEVPIPPSLRLSSARPPASV